MKSTSRISRRSSLKTLGALGALATVGAPGAAPAQSPERVADSPAAPARARDVPEQLAGLVSQTPFIDTHEHLVEERLRLDYRPSGLLPCDDWALLFSHYLNSDLLTAGMPEEDLKGFLNPGGDVLEKWRLLAPWWPAVKHTGYGQAVALTMEKLYGVNGLSEQTVAEVQAGYERVRKPGFYAQVLREVAGVESCQVNSITGRPFEESDQPELLQQDLSIVGMFAGPNIAQYARPAGVEVKDLSDWHGVIRWWFERYGDYAVAVKSQNAYSRDIDYARVPAEEAAPVFKDALEKAPVAPERRKLLEDHLFWYAVDQATARNLPVKLHTGYYAGQNYMPLERLSANAASAARLCRLSPDTQFVFMHIGYPYYEEMLAVAKHYTNAFVDMCWAWIINPVGSQDFLKKFLLTAPANKLFPFGGDYIPVEPVVGHAGLARRGIVLALNDLVREGWMKADDALALVEPLMRGNATRFFRLSAKLAALRQAPWKKNR